jgi:hypothetical protein
MSVRVWVTLEQRNTKTYEFLVADTDDEQLAAKIIEDQCGRTHPGWDVAVITTTQESGGPALKPVRSGVEPQDFK